MELSFWQAVLAALITLLVGSGGGGLVYAYVSRANFVAELEVERSNFQKQLEVEREKFKETALETARSHIDQQWMTLVDRLEARNDALSKKVAAQDEIIEALQTELARQRSVTFSLEQRQNVSQSAIKGLRNRNTVLENENMDLKKKVKALEGRLERYENGN